MVLENNTATQATDRTNVQQPSDQQNSNLNLVNVVKPGDFTNLPSGTNTASQHLDDRFEIVDSTKVNPGEQPRPAEQPKPADQLPAGEEKHGATTLKKDDQGQPKEYANGDYTLSKHDDGKWYYHQNGDGHDFVEVKGDSIKMDDQGKVTYSESGMFGKDNQTLGDGSTGFLTSITSAASHVEDAVVNHPLDTFNTIAFAPLAGLDAVAGTHTIKAIGEIEKGAVDEIVHHPGEILKDVAIGAAIGVATVATGGGALVALGIGAGVLATTELVKNDGNLNGVLNDAKAFGSTVADWGSDIATVAGTGQHTAEEEAAAVEGLHTLGAFGAHIAAGTAGGLAGGVGAEAAGLQNAVPNAVRSGLSRLRPTSDVPAGSAPRYDAPSPYDTNATQPIRLPEQTPRYDAPSPYDTNATQPIRLPEQTPRYDAQSPFDANVTQPVKLPEQLDANVTQPIKLPEGAVERMQLPGSNLEQMQVYQQLASKMIDDANLPPVAEGDVRLYRGIIDKAVKSELEPPPTPLEQQQIQGLIEKMRQGGQDMSSGKIPWGQSVLTTEEQTFLEQNLGKFVQGGTKFYADDPGIALKYASQTSPGGQVYYLDVPLSEAAKYIQSTAMAEGNSIGLPFELARNATVLGRVSRGDDWVAINQPH